MESKNNPTFSEAKEVISKEFSQPESVIDMHGILGGFGKKSFIIDAYVYDSEADLEKGVQKTQKQQKEEEKAIIESEKKEAENAAESPSEKKEAENAAESPSEKKESEADENKIKTDKNTEETVPEKTEETKESALHTDTNSEKPSEKKE